MLHVILCHAMSDEKCGDAMWNGVVHVEYGGVLWRCEMWLWNTERCGMVWRRHIRRGGVMRNDGLNAVWDVWCCGIVWCEIYIWMWCAWRGMWAYVDGVPRCGTVWSVLMWNVVRCECCQWCDWNAKCDVEYGVVWNVVSWYVECCICGMVCRDVVPWSDLMWNVVRCLCMWNVVRCECCHFRQCDWNVKCVMWNMVWCGMWCPGMWNVA